VSFAAPLVLLGLLVLLALAVWYIVEQRRRARRDAAFVTAPLRDSVAPHRPGIRRVIPPLIMALALAALIVAAAKPQIRVNKPVKGATVMLANDVSNSMTSTDVNPTRLAAAQKAAITFTEDAVGTIGVGSIEFARKPTLLQSPSTDHLLARQAVEGLKVGGGGTAIGEAIQTALTAIKGAPKVANKTPPGAIVLLSDGTSNVGPSPVTLAATAKKQGVKIYTIAIGTSAGTYQEKLKDGKSQTTHAPVNPTELQQIAKTSGGTFYSAPDQASASAIYTKLATQLGNHKVNQGLITEVAAAGGLLLLIGGGLSLRWFGSIT
jgi:Ca-activated chloride channel family protein